ncbi:MAG: hypothetical protein V2I43_02970, partial [Parvularcula sp.]|nr:hypothetical protein [Parvularcula sp.]
MMRVTTRLGLIAGVSLTALAACGENAAPTTAEPQAAEKEMSITDENARFDSLMEDAMKELLASNPQFASALNVPESEAGGRYKDRLGIPGLAGYEQSLARAERLETALASFNPEDLTEERREYLAILTAGQEDQDALEEVAAEAGYALAGSFQ